MAPSSKTENGISSWGGRLVSPIIGRFCGYLTRGRSPFSNGMVTVSSARAPKEPNAVPGPKRPDAGSCPFDEISSVEHGLSPDDVYLLRSAWQEQRGSVEPFSLRPTRLPSHNGLQHGPEKRPTSGQDHYTKEA